MESLRPILRQFHHIITPRHLITRSLPQLQRMSSTRTDSIPHELRTAAEPRQNRLYNVQVSHIEQVNPAIRLLQLTFPPATQQAEEFDQHQPFTFLPGQWLDVYIPSIPQAGGFTITSTPADAQVLPQPAPPTDPLSADETGLPPVDPQGRPPYVELAVQHSPSNPPAAWLWKPREEIIGKQLSIRIGGSFVWPPTGIDLDEIRNVVFIAGGVGINPLISMLSHLNDNESTALPHPADIHFLYSTRLPARAASLDDPEASLDQILFLPRIRQIVRSHPHSQSQRLRISLDLFITNLPDETALRKAPPEDLTLHNRRIHEHDLRQAVSGPDGNVLTKGAVCYVCGPPAMTDELVGTLKKLFGDGAERVFCEKWW